MARKNKSKSLDTTDICGFNLIKTDDKLVWHNSVNSLISHCYGLSGTMLMVSSFKMNESQLLLNGDFKYSGDGISRLTDMALCQLLGLLKIPLSYASRIPRVLLIESVNTLLSQNKWRDMSVFYGENKVVHGFSLSKYKSYCSPVDYVKACTGIPGVKFEFSVSDNKTLATMFSTYIDYSGKNGIGFELISSDTRRFNTTLTSYIFNVNGHAIISDSSIRLPNDFSIEDFEKAAESFASENNENMERLYAAPQNMKHIKVDAALAAKIDLAAHRAAGKTLGLNGGETLEAIYKRLGELRVAHGVTIKGKREVAILAGKLLKISTGEKIL